MSRSGNSSAGRQQTAVARLRMLLADQADRLDDLVDARAQLVPDRPPSTRSDYVDTLTCAALVAQAARDFAVERIGHVEYRLRLDGANEILPPAG